MYGSYVNSSPDGVVALLKADGSSAQLGLVQNQLIVTEKSNTIETVTLLSDGAVNGVPILVQNIPANVNTPFGLVTRGNDAYVTIAHANEISLVRNGTVLTVTSSDTQQASVLAANLPHGSAAKYAFGKTSPEQTTPIRPL